MQGLSNSNPYKFSRLRNLQLHMNIDREDADKILCLVSFLRATPLIEILEVHVSFVLGSYQSLMYFVSNFMLVHNLS
jgi:hypothetical protein